jgi:hypothetical protein
LVLLYCAAGCGAAACVVVVEVKEVDDGTMFVAGVFGNGGGCACTGCKDLVDESCHCNKA